MADIINFNKARKAKLKSGKKAKAEENRVSFGLTKGQKATNKTGRDNHGDKLDGLRIYRPGLKDDDEPD